MNTKALSTLVIAATLVLGGCMTFNRSALWNTPMQYEYCTYKPEQVKVGKTYVHLYDDWTKHRLNYKQELTVKDVIDDHTVLLDIGWLLADSNPTSWYDAQSSHLGWLDEPALPRHPILVSTIDKHGLTTNDVFSVYGQYVYIGNSNFPLILPLKTLVD